MASKVPSMASMASKGASASITPESFDRAVQAICQEAPRLGTALKHGCLRAVGPGLVTLAFPAGDFRATQLASERAAAEQLVGSRLGGSVRIELVEGLRDSDVPSLAQRDSQGEGERQDRIRSAALDSPSVRDALRILGGTVEEVRIGPSKAS
jgi:hypothetical protein